MPIHQNIQNRIHIIRGERIMLDYDLAQLYQVETKRINEQVKRNKERFPEDFMFRLTINEWQIIQSQNTTASQKKRNIHATPYAFTEHGVTMLASVLKSGNAIKMNIAIVRGFYSIKRICSVS